MKYEVHYFQDDVATIKEDIGLGETNDATVTHAKADQYRKDMIAEYEKSKAEK